MIVCTFAKTPPIGLCLCQRSVSEIYPWRSDELRHVSCHAFSHHLRVFVFCFFLFYLNIISVLDIIQRPVRNAYERVTNIGQMGTQIEVHTSSAHHKSREQKKCSNEF